MSQSQKIRANFETKEEKIKNSPALLALREYFRSAIAEQDASIKFFHPEDLWVHEVK
jgi:hypothetical protein